VDLALDPGLLASLAVAEGLYVRAVRVLRRRGVRVPRLQQGFWHAGMALWAIALLSPIGAGVEDHFYLHMAEHLLIADLGAPLLLAGVRNPVLAFYLPRSALVPLARTEWLRGLFRWLRKPLVAVPLWVLVLYGWHYGPLFEAATRNDLVHALQHGCLVGASLLVWWPALEPQRRRLRGELWKIGHIFAARLPGMFLGMAFLFAREPLYADLYGPDSLSDQQLAGGMMMTLDILIVVFALCFFFWRAAQADAEAQRSMVSGPSMPPSRWPGTEQ
jgi:cytochrome c oxidase assembly factor CtaG